jgi:hypothetical protein
MAREREGRHDGHGAAAHRRGGAQSAQRLVGRLGLLGWIGPLGQRKEKEKKKSILKLISSFKK